MRPLRSLLCCILVLPCLAGPVHEATAWENVPTSRESSVESGLAFLSKTQSTTGAWRTEQWGESVGVTGLAVLAFLSAGHLPDEGPYGQQLSRAVDWILSHQRADGLICTSPHSEGIQYEHGICTLLFAQLSGSAESGALRIPLEKAVRWILRSQVQRGRAFHSGGWPRDPLAGGNSDLSVTVWQLIALRAARNSGCDVPKDSLANAAQSVRDCWNETTGGFGAEPGSGSTPVTTAAAIVSLEYAGHHQAEKSLAGAEWLAKHLLYPNSTYFYFGSYMNCLGLHRLGNPNELESLRRLRNLLQSIQEEDGSWKPKYEREIQAGTAYCTSLAILSLTMEHRLLPAHEL